LASIYHQQQDYPAALSAYLLAIKHQPDYADAYNSLGNLYLDLGQINQAQTAFEQALTLDPHHPQAAVNLQEAYQEN
jgi:tetratricopeptide (TPR) repeat protein